MEQNRLAQVDILKGLAIISVVLLHSVTVIERDRLGGPYYFLQAVPVFMILAGLNIVGAYKRRDFRTLKDCYDWGYLRSRLDRLITPFILTFILEIIILLVTNKSPGLKHIVFIFLTGGYGRGSYFLPVMLQMTVTMPIFYVLARRNISLMLILAFAIDILFEVYAYSSAMDNSIYRLLYVRYLFAAALGIWLGMRKSSRSNSLMAVGAVLSLVYITLVHYEGFKPPFQPNWQAQNALSFFWPLALVVLGIMFLPKSVGRGGKGLVAVGHASYHIMLAQMVFFWTIGGRFISRFALAPRVFIDVVVCVAAGMLFYKVETLARKGITGYKRVRVVSAK